MTWIIIGCLYVLTITLTIIFFKGCNRNTQEVRIQKMTSKEDKYDEWSRYFFEVDKEMYKFFKQDLERKEKLEKENQELKEKYNVLMTTYEHTIEQEEKILDSRVKYIEENKKLKKAIEQFMVYLNIEPNRPIHKHSIKQILNKLLKEVLENE